MECDEHDDKDVNTSAVNSIILDYYKKFGRKRDLEQYFSLSTTQGEVRNPTGTFWTNMKVQSDSSDSGGKQSESSQELCRISIKCSIPDPPSSQSENTKSKSEPVSPPIIIEDLAQDISQPTSRCTDDGSGKSGDENSQKSFDVVLDTSIDKPISPSSSITSQRKLEWDSLADVGYANESEPKTSASSLSTLERLALQQQYSNNDTGKHLGFPTAHSTPVDESQTPSKSKRLVGKKSIKLNKRDMDSVELNVPQISENKHSQCINVHLTKHISFSVDKSGGLVVENIKNDVDLSPQKVAIDTASTSPVITEKVIQTNLNVSKENSSPIHANYTQKTPVLINVNTLKKKNRRKKLRLAHKKARNKKRKSTEKEIINVQERSGEQVSEAESFEYMPGHIYNQSNLKLDHSLPKKVVSNKSSLESSAVLTTDSSNGSKHSFTKDLEKSIELLKGALQHRYDDNLKNKLVKEIIQRLLKSKYRDDDSTTDFLSGLSFSYKKLGLQDSSTTSTHTGSDGNNTVEKKKIAKPKKSILRMDKFNANAIATTSQSTPNLPTAIHVDKSVSSKFIKPLTSSNTDSDISNREKRSIHTMFAKTSSEELYRKYLDAVTREEAYRKYLKDKEIFLKQKLTCSDSALKIPKKPNEKTNSKFQDLMNDLVTNNHNYGSGDAGKLEGSSDSNINYNRSNIKNQRSHSVYTLSSCNSCSQSKKPNLKKQLQTDLQYLSKPGSSRENVHYCCCPHHSMKNKFGVSDSSVQVNIKELDKLKENVPKPTKHLNCNEQQLELTRPVCSDYVTGDIKYVCLCSENVLSQDMCDNYLVYKCAHRSHKGIQSGEISKVQSKSVNLQSKSSCTCKHSDAESQTSLSNIDMNLNNIALVVENINPDCEQINKVSKSSQTNLNVLCVKSSDKSVPTSASDFKKDLTSCTTGLESKDHKFLVHETTRCIQTEISINPQISNPSLPDVHIINDTESVKIISEQVKEVSKHSSSDDLCSHKDRKDNDINNKNFGLSEENVDVAYKKEIQDRVNDKLLGEKANTNFQFNNNKINDADIITDNFTIPIQGTNMKLMVSIGSNDYKKSGHTKIDTTQARYNLAEKSDCPQESTAAGKELCKIIQYKTQTNKELINTNSYNPEYVIDHSSNKVNNNKHSKVQSQQVNRSCRDDLNALKFNTYSIKEKKSYTRSNSDTYNLMAYTQTNDINKKDRMSPKSDNYTDMNNKMYSSQMPEYGIGVDEVKNKHNSAGTHTETITRNTETQSDIPQSAMSIDPIGNLQPHTGTQHTATKCVGSGNIQIEGTELSKQPDQIIDQYKISPKDQSVHSSGGDTETTEKSKSSNDKDEQFTSEITISKEARNREIKDPILDIIKDITKRYSKDEIEKHKRKKCFKEIVTVLNYLLDTDDSTDPGQGKTMHSSISDNNVKTKKEKPVVKISESSQTINKVDKAVQMTVKKSKNRLCNTESSDAVTSTDLPSTSSDSATCKVLNKIKKECERFHKKRCKSHACGKKCDTSSSTSANCNQCNKTHRCSCPLHKCKAHKSKPKVEKAQKKSVAYNLIIQTSESVISEETACGSSCRPLQNIILRVPSRGTDGFIPFRELERKIEKRMPHPSAGGNTKYTRSKSCPNEFEISGADNSGRHSQECTVREYLEINRPDFIDKCVQRQDCLKDINRSRANERAVSRELLSAHVARESPLSALNIEELRQLARDTGIISASKKRKPKFLSERDMKKHSENIYKSLPEVKQKKEEVRRENIKKTNLLMANIFKKNLQKKALRGSVNLSNYSTVVKI